MKTQLFSQEILSFYAENELVNPIINKISDTKNILQFS